MGTMNFIRQHGCMFLHPFGTVLSSMDEDVETAPTADQSIVMCVANWSAMGPHVVVQHTYIKRFTECDES